MKYTFYASLHEDIDSGSIWISNYSGKCRAIVKIKHLDNKKSVYCEALKIENNFLNRYNGGNRKELKSDVQAIVANQWYRTKLGIASTGNEESIEIKEINNKLCIIYATIRACLQHPQLIIRLSTTLGLLGVALGVISIFI
ncbi:MAG: hypothetical protein IE909_17320 [Campylobacterales bacterium]|nr:hypothetical protein [Campylobacterales bacterium]